MTVSRRTRGRTSAGRLSLLDPWMAKVATERGIGLVVDVGLGARPDTTIELHQALKKENPGVRTIGLDVDPTRVQALMERQIPGIEAMVGGFDHRLPSQAGMVRAVNLLRQYRLNQVGPSLRAMGRWLGPGGLLVEGTTDKEGTRGCFRVFERRDWELHPVALVLVCDGAAGFDPRALTPYLPRGMGWHGHPGELLRPLFEAWGQAAAAVRDSGIREPKQVFSESCRQVGGETRGVDRGVWVVPVDHAPALVDGGDQVAWGVQDPG